MGKEIERKFIVRGEAWRRDASAGVPYRQGYLPGECTVRVRIAGDEAFLTLKGKPRGAARDEYEYRIPKTDADELLETLCTKPLIEKTRYDVESGGRKWVVDEFEGDNSGLIIAEIELDHEEQQFEKPAWAGAEVTADPRYTNRSLVSNPYRRWRAEGGA